MISSFEIGDLVEYTGLCKTYKQESLIGKTAVVSASSPSSCDSVLVRWPSGLNQGVYKDNLKKIDRTIPYDPTQQGDTDDDI